MTEGGGEETSASHITKSKKKDFNAKLLKSLRKPYRKGCVLTQKVMIKTQNCNETTKKWNKGKILADGKETRSGKNEEIGKQLKKEKQFVACA